MTAKEDGGKEGRGKGEGEGFVCISSARDNSRAGYTSRTYRTTWMAASKNSRQMSLITARPRVERMSLHSQGEGCLPLPCLNATGPLLTLVPVARGVRRGNIAPIDCAAGMGWANTLHGAAGATGRWCRAPSMPSSGGGLAEGARSQRDADASRENVGGKAETQGRVLCQHQVGSGSTAPHNLRAMWLGG